MMRKKIFLHLLVGFTLGNSKDKDLTILLMITVMMMMMMMTMMKTWA